MKTEFRTWARRRFFSKGMTLIEILVSIFILSLILFSLTSVFISINSSKVKSDSITWLKENTEYAMSSIAKEVRMGKIESKDTSCVGTAAPKSCLMITRNRDLSRVCFIVTQDSLEMAELKSEEANDSIGSDSCFNTNLVYKKIVDLAGRNMMFDTASSGFYVSPTDTETVVTTEKSRGWVEMNFNIIMAPESGMEADEINLQTSVSSRDYGWEEIP